MTREARMMSGIILITVPTIQYGGWGGTPQFIALGSPNRSATGCDSGFVGVVFLHAFANRYRSRGSSLSDLRRSSGSRPRVGDARGGIVTIAPGELMADSAFFDCDGTPIYAEKRLARASRPRRESHSSQTVRDEWGTR